MGRWQAEGEEAVDSGDKLHAHLAVEGGLKEDGGHEDEGEDAEADAEVVGVGFARLHQCQYGGEEQHEHHDDESDDACLQQGFDVLVVGIVVVGESFGEVVFFVCLHQGIHVVARAVAEEPVAFGGLEAVGDEHKTVFTQASCRHFGKYGGETDEEVGLDEVGASGECYDYEGREEREFPAVAEEGLMDKDEDAEEGGDDYARSGGADEQVGEECRSGGKDADTPAAGGLAPMSQTFAVDEGEGGGVRRISTRTEA